MTDLAGRARSTSGTGCDGAFDKRLCFGGIAAELVVPKITVVFEIGRMILGNHIQVPLPGSRRRQFKHLLGRAQEITDEPFVSLQVVALAHALIVPPERSGYWTASLRNSRYVVFAVVSRWLARLRLSCHQARSTPNKVTTRAGVMSAAAAM